MGYCVRLGTHLHCARQGSRHTSSGGKLAPSRKASSRHIMGQAQAYAHEFRGSLAADRAPWGAPSCLGYHRERLGDV